MLLRLFSGYRLNAYLAISLFALLLWSPSFIQVESIDFSHSVQPMPLVVWLEQLFPSDNLLTRILAFVLISLQSVLLVRLNSRFIFIQKRTFLPAFFFLAMVSFYYPMLRFSEYLFGSVGMMAVLLLLFSSTDRYSSRWKYFEAGLVLGISGLLYARVLYFFPFLWIAQLILRQFSIREWLLALVGLLLPFYVYTAWLYLDNQDPWLAWKVLYDNLNNFYFSFVFTRTYLMIAIFVFFLVAIASGYMLKVFQFRKIFIRNYFLSFFWLFFIAGALFSFLTRFDPGILYVAAIPVAFLLSNYFIHARKSLINNLLFSLFILLLLFNSLNHFTGWLD